MAETPQRTGSEAFRRVSIRSADLHVSRMAAILAMLGVAFLAVLAAAPLRPYFSEWRVVQTRYNRLAQEMGGTPVPLAVQQIWRPSLGIADRCVTCHLGMGTAATPIGGDPLFAAHPPIPHEPSAFGCTVCHGGQGRATTKDAAHGFVTHWDEELLDRSHRTAGCGTCHRDFPVIGRAELVEGQRLIEQLDCLSCHKVDGRGRGTAPELTTVGLRGYRRDWHAFHLAERQRQTSGPWRDSYGDISSSAVAAVDRWLRTRVGAPRIIEAQALAHERGCLGCHRIGGRGGEAGPALDGVGRKPVGGLKFDAVRGTPTLANYMRQHFLDPTGVVVGSLMPALTGDEAEADLLTSYVLFLRSRPLPPEFLPKARIRRDLLQEPQPSLSGAQLFGAFCAGCHGPDGRGRTYGNLDVHFPAIGSADFLDVAPDALIERTLRIGRPGRRMPALAASGGSLSDADVAAIVAHMRTLGPRPPTASEVSAASLDLAIGAEAYAADCSTCHGIAGEGTPLGSPLSAVDSRPDPSMRLEAIVRGVPGTAMAAYSTYDAATLRALIAYIDSLGIASRSAASPRVSAGTTDRPGVISRAAWRLGAGDAARGQEIYERSCTGCHGAKGEGKNGPALANVGLQQAVTPEYVAATVVRGRRASTMPAFGRDGVGHSRLTASDVLDVAAFVTTRLNTGATP